MNLARAVVIAMCLLAGEAVAQSLVLISDLNGRYGSTEYNSRIPTAVEAIIGHQPDAVISAGDMIAGQRKPLLDGPHIERMWQAFNTTVTEPLAAAGIPLAVTPGNHDGSGYPEFRLEQEWFDMQWKNRTSELEFLPGSAWPRRYATRIKGVLLISFDGTVPGRLPTTELEFLESKLAKYSRPEETTIVLSHLPIWPLSKGRETEILDDPRLLDLLHRYDVDIYVSGHHHVFHVATDEAGLLHLGVGALGGNVRPFSGESDRQRHSFVLLDLDGEEPKFQALIAPDFTQSIDLDTLPARIEGPLGQLERLRLFEAKQSKESE